MKWWKGVCIYVLYDGRHAVYVSGSVRGTMYGFRWPYVYTHNSPAPSDSAGNALLVSPAQQQRRGSWLQVWLSPAVEPAVDNTERIEETPSGMVLPCFTPAMCFRSQVRYGRSARLCCSRAGPSGQRSAGRAGGEGGVLRTGK